MISYFIGMGFGYQNQSGRKSLLPVIPFHRIVIQGLNGQQGISAKYSTGQGCMQMLPYTYAAALFVNVVVQVLNDYKER